MASNPSIIIDRLWMGESGAAPFRRKQGQVSSARNVRFDVALGGAAKRNPTILIRDLDGSSNNSPFDPTVEFKWLQIRGAIVAIGQGTVNGWDSEGNPLEIIDLTGGDFYDYIDVSNPRRNIAHAVSFDTVIVANRTTAVETLDTFSHLQSMRFIINGDINNGSGVPTPPTNLTNRTVDDFSRLPPQSLPQTTYEETHPEWLDEPANGDAYRVRYDYEFDPSGVYVYWDGPVHANARGYFSQHSDWHRIPASRQGNGRYDESTMPHRIVYNEGDGTLTLDTCPWKQRTSGNQATNRRMPFVNGTIAAVAFHHGRLFLVGQKHVTASRHDDYFNLWVENINAVADDDRIATDITQSDIGRVRHAIVCGKSLLINCDNGQLEFHSGDQPLTNANGELKMITDFQAATVEPAHGPNGVVLLDQMGDLHRFDYTNKDFGIVCTEMLTIHRRKLLWGKTVDAMYIVGMTLFLCIREDHMLVHDSFTIESQIVQSAWGEYSMQDVPVFVGAWEGEIRIVTRNDDSANEDYGLLSYLHREQEPGQPLVYMPRMDRLELIEPEDMDYDEDSNETTLSHTNREGDVDTSYVMRRDDDAVHFFQKAKRINGEGNPVFQGDLTNAAAYLGFTFDTELVLTKLFPGMTAVGITMQGLTVFHYETTDYELQATVDGDSILPEGRPYEWQPVRTDLSELNELLPESDFLECTAIVGDPRDIEITLSSASPGQVAWVGLEYEYQAGSRGRA